MTRRFTCNRSLNKIIQYKSYTVWNHTLNGCVFFYTFNTICYCNYTLSILRTATTNLHTFVKRQKKKNNKKNKKKKKKTKR